MEIRDQSYTRQMKIAKELDDFLLQVGINEEERVRKNHRFKRYKQIKVKKVLIFSMIDILLMKTNPLITK